MPLRIAFDLDGVLANMDRELVRQAELLFGSVTLRESPDATSAEGEPADEVPANGENSADALPSLRTLNLSSRQQRRLWRHVASTENFWETLEEVEPGMVARLAAVAVERRWEVIFLTKRPVSVGDTQQRQTQRWLSAKGFELPSVYVVHGSRGRIAAALGIDIVVDDRPENCLDVAIDSKARAILVWRQDEATLPAGTKRLGIAVVSSVGECLDALVQADVSDDRPGVMDRLKRLLGLSQPAGV